MQHAGPALGHARLGGRGSSDYLDRSVDTRTSLALIRWPASSQLEVSMLEKVVGRTVLIKTAAMSGLGGNPAAAALSCRTRLVWSRVRIATLRPAGVWRAQQMFATMEADDQIFIQQTRTDIDGQTQADRQPDRKPDPTWQTNDNSSPSKCCLKDAEL
ncbi:hypothetical protein E4U21_006779 [Claviceps maximensis]|nr:hypothetical protein E4U21_006779 [Claviceps maximensis]